MARSHGRAELGLRGRVLAGFTCTQLWWPARVASGGVCCCWWWSCQLAACAVSIDTFSSSSFSVLAALPSSLSFSVDAAGRRRSTALADATVATRCRRSLPTQTPPLLAAGARHRRRRRHRPLALASDHHVPGCLARGSASHPDAQLQPQAGCSDSALRDSEMTQIETWNYFVGTWKRHRGSSE